MKWLPEHTEEGWCPTLVDDGLMFSLPVWFATEELCREFIATIPPGIPSPIPSFREGAGQEAPTNHPSDPSSPPKTA